MVDMLDLVQGRRRPKLNGILLAFFLMEQVQKRFLNNVCQIVAINRLYAFIAVQNTQGFRIEDKYRVGNVAESRGIFFLTAPTPLRAAFFQ